MCDYQLQSHCRITAEWYFCSSIRTSPEQTGQCRVQISAA
jgi:hypothetical protein